MCPANAPKPEHETTSEDAGPRLSLDHTPKLRALVEGPGGAEILLELQRLLRRESVRAPRYARDLLARIRAGADAAPEIAVVRDISRSGVRLELGASARLDVMHARTVSIEMRLPGMGFVSRDATLVRVVERREKGVELAFAFSPGAAEDAAFDALLERLASKPAGMR